jgi:hypothetical protein
LRTHGKVSFFVSRELIRIRRSSRSNLIGLRLVLLGRLMATFGVLNVGERHLLVASRRRTLGFDLGLLRRLPIVFSRISLFVKLPLNVQLADFVNVH